MASALHLGCGCPCLMCRVLEDNKDKLYKNLSGFAS